MKENKTYFDKLMQNKEFRDKFTEEYQNVCIGERIAKACDAYLKIDFVFKTK